MAMNIIRPSGRRSAGRAALAIAAAAAAAALVTACSSGSSSGTSAAAANATGTPSASMTPSGAASSGTASTGTATTATLKTEHAGGGTVLANAKGYTVYWFSADHGTTSACTGSCAATWPPVTGTPMAASGVTLTGKLGTITRQGGIKQATYNGHPLYTFKLDTAPGQVHGNGVASFGGTWYSITVTGSSKPASSPSSGGGYGY